VTGDVVTDDRVAGHPTAGDLSTSDRVSGDPVTGASRPGDLMTDGPATDDLTTRSRTCGGRSCFTPHSYPLERTF
jgi:hypothetical protein